MMGYEVWVTGDGEWTPGRVDIQGTLTEIRKDAPWIQYLKVTRCSDYDCTLYGNSEAM